MTMSAPPRTRAQLLLALSQRNWDDLNEHLDELADVLGEEGAQNYLRCSVLPQCSTETVEAFWRFAMTPEQFDQLMDSMAMATTCRLETQGFQLGSEFSYTVRQDGLRQLLLNDAAQAELQRFYSQARYSTLRILLA